MHNDAGNTAFSIFLPFIRKNYRLMHNRQNVIYMFLAFIFWKQDQTFHSSFIMITSSGTEKPRSFHASSHLRSSSSLASSPRPPSSLNQSPSFSFNFQCSLSEESKVITLQGSPSPNRCFFFMYLFCNFSAINYWK